jgi:hypothetical protein
LKLSESEAVGNVAVSRSLEGFARRLTKRGTDRDRGAGFRVVDGFSARSAIRVHGVPMQMHR